MGTPYFFPYAPLVEKIPFVSEDDEACKWNHNLNASICTGNRLSVVTDIIPTICRGIAVKYLRPLAGLDVVVIYNIPAGKWMIRKTCENQKGLPAVPAPEDNHTIVIMYVDDVDVSAPQARMP